MVETTRQIRWRNQVWTVREKVRTLPMPATCFVCRGDVIAGQTQVAGECGVAHAAHFDPAAATVTNRQSLFTEIARDLGVSPDLVRRVWDQDERPTDSEQQIRRVERALAARGL